MEIFGKDGDYFAFLKLLEEARKKTHMRILAYCLMPNHWHMVLWPRKDGDLARFVGWVANTHVRRWRAHRGNEGEGHLYQGRYKSFIVNTDSYLLTLLRYVEQNPLRAGIASKPTDWPWSSAVANPSPTPDPWPIPRPQDWHAPLPSRLPEKTLGRIHQSLTRNQPLGDDAWTAKLAKKLNIQHTLRDPWRPNKNRNTTKIRG